MLEIVKIWEEFLQQKVSLVCFKEGSDEIVGLNLCAISSEGDPEIQVVIHVILFRAQQRKKLFSYDRHPISTQELLIV